MLFLRIKWKGINIYLVPTLSLYYAMYFTNSISLSLYTTLGSWYCHSQFLEGKSNLGESK